MAEPIQPQGASLRITINITNQESLYWLTKSPADPKSLKNSMERDPFKGLLNRGQLDSQRDDMNRDLEEIKDAVGENLELKDWNTITHVLHRLFKRGRILAYQLLGVNNLGTVERTFLAACPGWDNEARRPHLIEVDAPLMDIVPLELFPLFGMTFPGRITEDGRLFQVARRFLGFSTIVKRVNPHSFSEGPPDLKAAPTLPVKFFRSSDLDSAQRELDFLLGRKELKLDHVWPTKRYTDEQFARNLASFLCHPERRFNNSKQHLPDQIHHFSCHCSADDDLSGRSFLSLGGAYRDYEVTIDDLTDWFADRSNSRRRTKAEGLPLIFLNACGSSIIRPSGVASFPGLFLGNGNRGFIGTETSIPDDFAAEFSIRFYSKLFQRKSLGRAVHSAKWSMLQRYRNPLGIFYTVYANTDTKISNRRN
jgi:hypothetical protein